MYGLSFKPQVGAREHFVMTSDWRDLIDPRICAILLALAEWTMRKWGIGVVITCLNRTTLENVKVGGSIYSAHLRGRAADIRSYTFTDQQIKGIIEYLDTAWGDFLYVKYHNSGNGPHIHINIRYKHRRGRYGRSQQETV